MTIGTLAVLAGCAGQSEMSPTSYPSTWVLAEGLCEPETIIHDEFTDRLIVSNICGFKKNGEGYLSIVNMDGTLHTESWIDGLNAPAGMAILDRTLYVTDLDRVQVIDLDKGNIIDVLGPFENAKAFNDLAVDADGAVYISDSARHKVLKITDGQATFFPNERASFQYANGMHIEGNTLYVGGEKLWKIRIKSRKIKEMKVDGLADIDGIESDGEGGLSVSVVGGDVWHIPQKGRPAIWTAPDLSSTNHAHIPGLDLVLVPTGYDNTIITFQPK